MEYDGGGGSGERGEDMPLKVGMRVTVNKESYQGIRVGHSGVITGIDKDTHPPYIYIEFDTPPGDSGNVRFFYEHELDPDIFMTCCQEALQ